MALSPIDCDNSMSSMEPEPFASDLSNMSFSNIHDDDIPEDDPFNATLDKILNFDQPTDDEAIIFDDMFAFQDPFHDLPLVSEDDDESERSKLSNDSSSLSDKASDDKETSITTKNDEKVDRKKKSQKPSSDMPTRPKRSLSAYNLFFKAERARLLADIPDPGVKPRRSHGKLGFADMAKTIAANWKKIAPEAKVEFQRLSKLDVERFNREFKEWKELTGGVEPPSTKKKNKRKNKKKEDGKKATKKAKTTPKTELPEKTPPVNAPCKVDPEPVTKVTPVRSKPVANVDPTEISTTTRPDSSSTEPISLSNVISGNAGSMLVEIAKPSKAQPVEHVSESTVTTKPASILSTSDDNATITASTDPKDIVDLTEPKSKSVPKSKKKKERKNKKQPRLTPRRSLSAYNLFFQAERAKLLATLPEAENKPKKSHGKIGFAEMAKTIAKAWKQITPEQRLHFDYLSAMDAERYEREMEAYKKSQYEKDMKAFKATQEKLAARKEKELKESPNETTDEAIKQVEAVEVDKVEAAYVESNEKQAIDAAPVSVQPGNVSMFLRKNLCRVTVV